MWRKAKRRNGQAQCGAKRKRAGAGVSLTRWLRHGPVAADERGVAAFLKKGLAKNGKNAAAGYDAQMLFGKAGALATHGPAERKEWQCDTKNAP